MILTIPIDLHQPQEYSLVWFWALLPKIVVWIAAVGFLGVVLAFGIFRPRKQMPNDIFSVHCVDWG